MKLALHILSIEMRKIMSYRADFWIGFLVEAAVDLSVAFFLWKTIFLLQPNGIAGMQLTDMMRYYLIIPFVKRMIHTTGKDTVSIDIYQGTLTRYLIYPTSFLGYKYLSNLAFTLLTFFQIVAAMVVMHLIAPDTFVFEWHNILMGIAACWAGSILYFLITATLEMAAFWADNVWSLNVLMKLLTMLLGGGMLPLTLYPEWARLLLAKTPFPLLFDVPIRTFTGHVSASAFGFNLLLAAGWGIFVFGVSKLVWSKGIRTYTGVGM